MKVVILAGGLGSRLAEETELRPKPMVEIGGRPILWHIIKMYSGYGFNEFLIALGYKGDAIKHYFCDYYALSGGMTVDISTGRIEKHDRPQEDWRSVWSTQAMTRRREAGSSGSHHICKTAHSWSRTETA